MLDVRLYYFREEIINATIIFNKGKIIYTCVHLTLYIAHYNSFLLLIISNISSWIFPLVASKCG